MKRLTATLASLTFTFASAEAAAQVSDTTLAVSAERLTGFHLWKASVDTPFGDNEPSGTMVNFLVANTNPADGLLGVNPFAVPRIAFDGVISNWTVGGTFGVAHASTDPDGPGPDQEVTAFAFAPRGGYILDLTDTIAFWPRFGFTFVKMNFDPGGGDAFFFDLLLEPSFVFSPTENVGITVGVSFDIGLTGEIDFGPTSQDARLHNFGLPVVGLVLLF